MSKRHRRSCRVLNYVDHLLIVFFAIIGCVFTSDFTSSVGILIGITSSVIGLKVCAITPGIRKYKIKKVTSKKQWLRKRRRRIN